MDKNFANSGQKFCNCTKGALLVDRWSDDIGDYTVSLGMEYLHPYYRMMTLSRVDEIKSYGLGVNVWTVNEEKDMLEMIEMGVDGIITNYPNRLNQLLKTCKKIK